MTKVFGIALEPHLITNEKTAKYFNYLRTYQVTDLEDGFKGFGKVCLYFYLFLFALILLRDFFESD